jgi:hypothetical protein
MRKLLTALCAVALVLGACQKEPSAENPDSNPGGGNTEGTKLVRLTTLIGDDSIAVDYSYNGFNRLTRLVTSGTVDNFPVDFEFNINRNATNVITSTVVRSPFFIDLGLETDSIVTTYVYDMAAGRYAYAVTHLVQDNEPQSDSAIFNYDAAGNLSSTVSYADFGTGYEPVSKEEYVLAGNNLSAVKSYEFTGSDFELITTEMYEYDTKINPHQSVPDAPILGMLDFYSANNPTKRTTLDEETQETYVTTVAYTYNSSGRPTQSNGTDGSSTSIVNYYYQ